ncbi:HTH-type transcriptional regulator BsdA [Cohnella xylanilytica]|uniref:LysR family transcriptional regulator n=1 Tax=Cohnella xylanilytica TaxID=557555 RepID=UPI001B06B52F|nr:LysR family transcriptional regulator [Cohnella xylanilytica]GIO15998.1 HTH-type transcriptional regulator BsdA [Cohnella xylanilytica]
MDIRQLRYFIAIAEERTISAAARRLHLSQPPLSQQLKAMEEELGAELAERSGKVLELTEAGKTLYAYARQMVELMEEAKTEVKEVGIGANGRLAIGVNTFSAAGLPEVLRRFRELYPKVTYKIQQNESSYLCRLVRDRAVELAFVRLPLELGDDLAVLRHYSEPYYLITSANGKSFGPEVSLADIADLPLLLPSTQGLGVHASILEAFSQSRLHPNLAGECSDISLLLSLVSSGFCASIVPAALLDRREGCAVRASRISHPADMASSAGLIGLKNHRLSKAAQHFIELLPD